MKQRREKASAGTRDAAAARAAEAAAAAEVATTEPSEAQPAPAQAAAPPQPAQPAHLARAHDLMGRGAYVQAAEAFGAALTENPEDVDAIAGLGASHLARAQFDGAEREFRKAIKLAPNAPDGTYQLGVTLCKRGVDAADPRQWRRAFEQGREHSARDGM
ncbi:MAG: tetratricopeptide repeat protein, partial [Gemmatimonadetes bacterium]|nr:tetratricopeptide repeat protein [Gemmatimonadota bacterium]